jgi:hypothetical protein
VGFRNVRYGTFRITDAVTSVEVLGPNLLACGHVADEDAFKTSRHNGRSETLQLYLDIDGPMK